MNKTSVKILLVDSDAADARLVEKMLSKPRIIPFELTVSLELGKALPQLVNNSFDVILLDLFLPDSQGLDTLTKIRTACPDTPIVVLSDVNDMNLAVEAVQEGAQDYLPKGHTDSNDLVRSIRYAMERKRMEEELRQTLDMLRKSLNATILVIARTAETKDPYTAGHQRRVANLARTIATEMRIPRDQIDGIRMAGVIHDLGKLTVPAEILSKPGTISAIEFNLVKTHPLVGYEILKDIDFPWPIAQIVLQHHERLDGSGYPSGLSGEHIIIEARILGVADVVEAMSSHRPYRPALGIDMALDEITRNRGILYDSLVVDACLECIARDGLALMQENEAVE